MRGTVFSRLRLGATKLLRDQRGNALMLTAAAIIPVVGIVGSAIDIGRAYMAQLRLQQACDAGVLAGRRYMSGSTYSDDAKTEASNMFAFNYPIGLYGSQNVAFSSSWVPAGSEVAGTASTRLPTQIMYMFGFDAFNLTANCGAKLEIANVDVMLVLDVTTSMTWYPDRDVVANPVTSSRLAGLKNGATLFLDTLLSTSSNEGTLRVGMVPYGGAANVGRILKEKNASWIADTVTIPSRTWSSGSNFKLENRTFSVAGVAVGGETSAFTKIAKGKTGNVNGDVKVRWGGCVMERDTVVIAPNATTIPAGAYDMDINKVPDASDATKWRLYLPTLAWVRNGTGSTNVSSDDKSIGDTTNSYAQCTTSEAMNLTVMKQGKVRNETNISAYGTAITNLHPVGYTYHDAGMVWGARLISPKGLFKDVNVRTDSQTVGRHIIFMTDGDMNTPRGYYSHQGMEQAIPRVGGSGDTVSRHNNRLKLQCDAAKAEGITIWVIAFSTSVNDYGPLDYCASSGTAYRAPDSTKLASIFKQIAGQISKLRLSK